MKVCFDTCTVIDILAKTDWFFDAYCAYDVALSRGFSVCLSVSSTTDICYLLQSRGFASRKRAREITTQVLDLFELIENTAQDAKNACCGAMNDYEDALIAYSAFRAGVDILITRNKKDFLHSPVVALDPSEFVSEFKSEDITYSEEVLSLQD